MDSSCDWQITKQMVSQRGQYLLETGQWSDCRFIVGQEPQQQILEGHKLFLAMSSPVFEAMFYGSMAEKTDPIPIRDVQPEAFKTLLEYIYTDHIFLESFELACELCYCAKKYMLPYLVEECTKYLWSDLSPKKACRAYEFAKLFEEPVLLEKCFQMICLQTHEILMEPSWDEVEIGTISMMFDQDDLEICSEIELFDAVEKWAKAECNRKSLLASDPKCLRSVTGNLIQKIRFLTLTPQEFADGPSKSQLLTRDEVFAILMNVSSSGSDIPMPAGFTTETNKRRNLKLRGYQNGHTLGQSVSVQCLWKKLADDGQRLALDMYGKPSNPFGSRDGKYYCHRSMSEHTYCLNSSVLDCSVTFKVDKNICIIGVQVPTQINHPDNRDSSSYTEILYAHLLDSDGSRLTYTHFTTVATCKSLVEICFNRPVYIQKNKIYRVGVVFNKVGKYPIGDCVKEVFCDAVFFNFGVGRTAESVRDGLIRCIVFSYH